MKDALGHFALQYLLVAAIDQELPLRFRRSCEWLGVVFCRIAYGPIDCDEIEREEEVRRQSIMANEASMQIA